MITILGSTGFVGSSLLLRLKETEKKVTGLSRPSFDLGDTLTYSAIPESTRILVHSAGPAGPEHPEDRYWKECVQATYNLMDFINSERNKIELIMYISSGAVYKPSSAELNEQSETGPENLYGMTRLLSETIISNKARCRNVHLRLFFPYGPKQQCPRLIPELVRKIKSGQTIHLNGTEGLPILNPIYIEDLADQLVEIMYSSTEGIVNLGGEEPVSIKTLAETIGQILDQKPVFEVHNKISPNFFCTSSYSSQTSLANGLKSLFKQRISDV